MGYSATEAFEDYRIGLMQCPLIMVIGAALAHRAVGETRCSLRWRAVRAPRCEMSERSMR
jgi:hypothetical protein